MGVEPKNKPFNFHSQDSQNSQKVRNELKKEGFANIASIANRVQKVKKQNIEELKAEVVQETDHIDLMDAMIRIPQQGFFNCEQFTERYMQIHKHWRDGNMSDEGKSFLLGNIIKHWKQETVSH